MSSTIIRPVFYDGDYRKALLISVLVHVLLLSLLGFYSSDAGSRPRSNDFVTITLFTEDSSRSFVPSELMEAAEVPPEDTLRISDRDTVMRGEQQRADVDAADQSGVEKDVLILQDRPESPEVQGSVSSAAATSANITVDTESDSESQASAEVGHAQAPPGAPQLTELVLPETPASPGGDSHVGDASQSTVQRAAVATMPRNATSPASRLSFQEEKTRLEGRAPLVGRSSWDARATELGEYQAEIYRRVGELWHRMIRERRSLITYGRAVINVEISSSGRIMQLQLREWPERGTMLGVVSEASVRRAGPFPEFSDALRLQVGNSLQLELTFVVY